MSVRDKRNGRNLIRTRQRQPDFVRKAGPMHDKRRTQDDEQYDIDAAIQEWADDLNDEHDVFE